jgi:hypothetical protein
MALLHHCDRCGRAGQVVQILGKDVGTMCCVPKLRTWLGDGMPAAKVVGGKIRNRLQQAMHVLERRPTVTAEEIAAANGETTRKAYEGLRIICRTTGKLRHLGRGEFALPVEEVAAE